MKSKLKKLVTVVVMACMCVCLSDMTVNAATYSISDEMDILKGLTNVGHKYAYKEDIYDDCAQVKPNNGLQSYSSYVTVRVVWKYNGAIMNASDGTACRSDERLHIKYYTGQAAKDRKYYLAATLYPNASNFYNFKYVLTP